MGEPEVPPFPQPPSWRERVDLLVGARPAGARLAAGAVAAVVAVAVVVVLVVRDRPGPPPELRLPVADTAAPATATGSTTTVPATVLAHAAGAVVAPGVYRLPGGARVTDLVEAAGGPAPGADLDRLNLAAPLADGQRVYLPVEGEAVPVPAVGDEPAAGPVDGGAGPLDLNTATAEQLDELPGVGPATAAAILEERDRRGGFASVDDLLDVPGIGDGKLARLRDLVRV